MGAEVRLWWIAMLSAGLVVLASPETLRAQAPLDITRALPPVLEDLEMRIVTVELDPGQSSPPHRHNAHVYVFVLEGTIEMQVEGGELTRLGPGETFYETPDDVHVVSRNASSTEPARFLVHMLKKAGAPSTVPAH